MVIRAFRGNAMSIAEIPQHTFLDAACSGLSKVVHRRTGRVQ